MNQRVIYTNADGSVSVIIPAPECGLSIEQIAAKDVPAGLAYEVVDASVIPSDRTFRNAWERAGAAVSVSLPKAKGIAHDKRRAARATELRPLDIEVTIPAKAAEAEAARQAIRDKYATMQSAIDACSSVDQIKAVIAGILHA